MSREMATKLNKQTEIILSDLTPAVSSDSVDLMRINVADGAK